MKNIANTLLLLLSSVIPGTSNLWAGDAPPVVHFSFTDEMIRDQGPHEFESTVNGDQLTPNSGKVGEGLFVGGTEDWLDVAIDSRLQLTNGATLEFWFVRDDWENPYRGGSGWQTLVHLDGITVNITAPGCPNHPPWLVEASVGWDIGEGFENGRPITLSSETMTVEAGAWYHVAVVHDPLENMTILYLNSEAVCTKKEAPPLTENFVNPLRVGTWYKANQAFRGTIDEIKIFDYPRTAEQIQGSYAGR